MTRALPAAPVPQIVPVGAYKYHGKWFMFEEVLRENDRRQGEMPALLVVFASEADRTSWRERHP